MFKIYLVGLSVVALNIVLHAAAAMFWVSDTNRVLGLWQKRLTRIRILKLLIFSFLVLTVLHIIHCLVWAIAIYFIPSIGLDFQNLHEIFYYSLVTFTTLGYGDMTISTDWRILSGIEAINGIMLIGWSTALMYSLIQNIYKNLREYNV